MIRYETFKSVPLKKFFLLLGSLVKKRFIFKNIFENSSIFLSPLQLNQWFHQKQFFLNKRHWYCNKINNYFVNNFLHKDPDCAGVETLATGFAELAVDLQIPTSLQEVGISQGDLSLLAAEAIKVRIFVNLIIIWSASPKGTSAS